MFRPEYPRPDLVRENWLNLNGAWEYETDRARSGEARGLSDPSAEFREKIEVPFCRESALSGIGDKDFCEAVWYRKTLSLPASFAGKRVLLHVGACDFRTTLWVNGKKVGAHVGGYTSFSFEVTPYLGDGDVTLVLLAEDDVRSRVQPAGKQCQKFASYGCSYTRTTGIWQTVWLEAVEDAYIVKTKFYPDVDAKMLTAVVVADRADGMTVRAVARYEGRVVGSGTAVVHAKEAVLTIPLSELHLWEVGKGRLYDLELSLGDDKAESYFGMRNIGLKDGIFYLNGKPVFQRLVLDQGFYPDGIYTAPSDDELRGDIERSMAMGFNGARLHQKVFEARFLYHCDRLGYLVWGEDANWGLDISRPEAWQGFLPAWIETLERDFNHPAIVGWCPLNETQSDQNPDFVRVLASLTRAIDPTRLYIETSGWCHVAGLSDMVDIHDYTQDPAAFSASIAPLAAGNAVTIHRPHSWNLPEETARATFMSEYGGIRWVDREVTESHSVSWGYGNTPASPDEFLARFKGLTEALLFNKGIGALCYTQLTDVEQEQNGLYTYDRQPKFDPALFRAILSQKAAIEE